MRTLQFIINGTQEDETANPLPKKRYTKRQQWTPGARRYQQWENYVSDIFREKARGSEMEPYLTRLFDRKPLDTGKLKCKMTLKIFWKGEAHGDPENIFGSIADALFVNDKYLEGEFKYEQSKEKRARVEVTIEIDDGRGLHTGDAKRVGRQRNTVLASKRRRKP